MRVHACYQGEIAAPAPQGAVATATVVLTHAGGALSQVVSRWTATPKPPVRVAFQVSGTGGSVRYDSAWPQEIRVADGLAEDVVFAAEPPFFSEIGEFARALAGGPEPRVGARDALAAVRITQAAAESAWSGQAVELEPGPGREQGREPGPEQEPKEGAA